MCMKVLQWNRSLAIMVCCRMCWLWGRRYVRGRRHAPLIKSFLCCRSPPSSVAPTSTAGPALEVSFQSVLSVGAKKYQLSFTSSGNGTVCHHDRDCKNSEEQEIVI